LRTPALVIDRARFASNCARVTKNAEEWGAVLRAHLKTHKTAEGSRYQLVNDGGRSDRVIVSTLMEAWEVMRSGLVTEGVVKDLLYGLPVAGNKIADLALLRKEMEAHGGTLRLFVDHPEQIHFLEAFNKVEVAAGREAKRWSVFVKINGGQNRAGIPPDPIPAFREFLSVLFTSPAVSLFGFYSHAGNSYFATNLPDCEAILGGEVDVVQRAARIALDLLKDQPSLASSAATGIDPNGAGGTGWVLSVGSTPAAHSASADFKARVAQVLLGSLELHAGNYPLLDVQQLYTTLVGEQNIAQRVLGTVVSYYPARGPDGLDEAMCDIGALGVSKDTGKTPGFGEIVGVVGASPERRAEVKGQWRLGRISQEHGVLTELPAAGNAEREKGKLKIGDVIEVVGQHACLICAGYPWYYIVDSSERAPGDLEEKVADVWVPWKGW